MIAVIKHKNLTWIDLVSPSTKEINEVAEKYPMHPLVAEELTSLTLRPKVDVYPENIYLILHFPSVNPAISTSGGCEIDFVIGKDFLITARYGSFSPLEKFLRNARAKTEFREQNFQNHAGFLAFKILKESYDFSLTQIDHLYLKINKIEKRIFDGNEKETVKKISFLKRDILDFRRTIYPHDSVLASFEHSGKEFFGQDFGHYLNSLSGEYTKTKNLIESGKEIIETLRETNESLLSTKTNEVIKILTILAFITFPLMLISSIFGMNTNATPIVGAKGDFWIITLVMITATAGMFLYFKKKKWL